MTYFIQDFSTPGQIHNGTIQAEKPKQALSRYLLYYLLDKETIQYCKRATRSAGSDFKVFCTETGKSSYFIIM